MKSLNVDGNKTIIFLGYKMNYKSGWRYDT